MPISKVYPTHLIIYLKIITNDIYYYYYYLLHVIKINILIDYYFQMINAFINN